MSCDGQNALSLPGSFLRPYALFAFFAALSLLWHENAAGEQVCVSWTNATLNVDGTPYADPDFTRIYYGECTAGDVPASALIQLAPTTEESACIDLASGDWCFRATHVNLTGEESEQSNLATFTVTEPAPPSDLAVTEQTAYAISQSNDRLVLYPVGTVAVGTTCDSTMSVNGKYRVNKAMLVPAGNVDPPVVLATCGEP